MTQAKSPTLSYRLCYNLLWVVTPKIESNTKQTVVKNEHFTAVFLYPKERKEVAEMANRNRTNPVQFYLDDDEQYILDEKFRVSGMKSNSKICPLMFICSFLHFIFQKNGHEKAPTISD